MELLLGTLLAADRIAYGYHCLDEGIQVHGAGQEIGRIPGGILVIAVEADVIDFVVALGEHLIFPGAEGRHIAPGGTAGDQLNGGICPLHQLAGFAGDTAVLRGGTVTHLPGTVHFIAQAPQLNVERILCTVADAQIAPVAAGGMISILHHVPRRIRSTGAQVDGIHDLGIRSLCPPVEFVEADFVGFRGEPGQIQLLGPLRHRTDAVLPVEAGHKVAAGIADNGNAQFAHQVNYILAETIGVGSGMTGLINTAINRPSQMFNKGTVDPGIHLTNHIVPIHNQGCLLHAIHTPSTMNKMECALAGG